MPGHPWRPALDPVPPFALALASLVGLSSLWADGARAAIRVVPAGYATVQDAIDASSPGDTVRVEPGDYIESLVLRTSSLQLEGAGAALTRIRGFSGATLRIDPEADGVRVRGLMLRAAPGVVSTCEIAPGADPRLDALVIDGGTIGLRVLGGSPEVTGSEIRSCTIGVSIEGTGGALFTSDSVSDNLLGFAVSGDAAPVARHCRIERNGIYNLQVSSFTEAASLDMTHNWWGTIDESSLRARIRIDGSAPWVSVNVDPWCVDPSCLVMATEPARWGALKTRFHTP